MRFSSLPNLMKMFTTYQDGENKNTFGSVDGEKSDKKIFFDVISRNKIFVPELGFVFKSSNKIKQT